MRALARAAVVASIGPLAWTGGCRPFDTTTSPPPTDGGTVSDAPAVKTPPFCAGQTRGYFLCEDFDNGDLVALKDRWSEVAEINGGNPP